MPAVAIEIVHVQAQFGALQPSLELAAEYAIAQGLGFAQGIFTLQAFGLKLTCTAVDDGIHALSPCPPWQWRVGDASRASGCYRWARTVWLDQARGRACRRCDERMMVG